jgi:hypothetical protein
LAALRRGALTKGLLGGRRSWMVIGAFVWAPRLLKRLLGQDQKVVATEVLEPGQAVRIEAIRPTTRSERRIASRAR